MFRFTQADPRSVHERIGRQNVVNHAAQQRAKTFGRITYAKDFGSGTIEYFTAPR